GCRQSNRPARCPPACRLSGPRPGAPLPQSPPCSFRPPRAAWRCAAWRDLKSLALSHEPGQLAERADLACRHLPAQGAWLEIDGLPSLEGRPGLIEKPEEEIVLRARRRRLESVQQLLVSERRGAGGERTLVHDVVD